MRGLHRLVPALLLIGLAATACAAFRPAPLDLAPGQRLVLGRLEVTGFDLTDGYVELVRDDGSFGAQLPVERGPRDFAIGLPPGRYRMTRLRGSKDRDSIPNRVVWDLPALSFEVGAEPAVYIGTLRLKADFATIRVSVVDELDQTLTALRAHYSNLPPTVTRGLINPT